MNKLSVYIMTYNEADKIEDAIRSVLWADEVIIADSNSNDGTIEMAEQLGAKVIQIPFKTFGQIRNDAIAACKYDWIFSLDADERCTKESHAEILHTLQQPQADAYYVPRRNWFLGQWVNHSGWYPDYRQPQLFKRGSLVFDNHEEVHEAHAVHGSIAYLKEDIIQVPFKDMAQMLHKMQRYSTLGAKKVVRQNKGGGIMKGLLRGIWAFFRQYILKLGILDGRAGFIIALGNFEGTFYRYAKAEEILQEWNGKPPASRP